MILHCRFARKFWANAPLHRMLDLDQVQTLKDALIAGVKLHCLPSTGVSSPVFLWIFWSLWIARNKLIFEFAVLTPSEVIQVALRSPREWILAQPTVSRPNILTVAPAPISPDSISIFTDAAWRASDGATGCGWIFKGSTLPDTQHGSKCFDYIPSALVGEELVVRLVLSQTLSSGFSKVCVFLDCQVLIRTTSSKSPPVKPYRIVRYIEILSFLFESLSLFFVSRTLNSEADLLAKAVCCNVGSSTG